MYSKKYKLPKKFWKKGESKFLFIRLATDKSFVNPYLFANSFRIVRLSFWQKLINWLNNLIQ